MSKRDTNINDLWMKIPMSIYTPPLDLRLSSSNSTKCCRPLDLVVVVVVVLPFFFAYSVFPK